jgi:hypothetical protein
MTTAYPTREQALKRARQNRWLENSARGDVIVDVKVSREMVEQMIDMGYLRADESEKRDEIAKAFLTEHADLVELHKK